MDEMWERAVEVAMEGEKDVTQIKSLTLDGAVNCIRLPNPLVFEKFQYLHHLSLANIGLSSLEHFPKLINLQKLILSDNRISTGLDLLVSAELNSLKDLDLSNNRITNVEDLGVLGGLKLVSLDLYKCPVTRVKDYRARVFGLITGLKYLDKTDTEGMERPESEDEEEEDEEIEEGSGEIEGDDIRNNNVTENGNSNNDGAVDEEESGSDEESNMVVSNGFDDEEVSDDEDSSEDDEEEESDGVENEIVGRLVSEGIGIGIGEDEIDGHEQGEDDGETGEEEIGDDEEEEDENAEGYLVQPARPVEEDGDMQPDLEMDEDIEVEDEDEEDDDDGEVQVLQQLPSTSAFHKRKRNDDSDEDDDDGSDNDDEDEDVVDHTKSPKHW